MLKIRTDFIAECEDDFVGLWNPIRDIRLAHPEWSDEDVKFETLFMLEELLDNGTIVAVNPYHVKDAWIPYPNTEWAIKWIFDAAISGPANPMVQLKDDNYTIMKKIEEKWDALGRDPNIMEIIHFTSADYDCPIDTTDLEWDGWSV